MVATQQQQAVRPVGVRLVRDEDITAKNRLDTLSARRLIELNQAEKIREIGQGDGRHAVFESAQYGRTIMVLADIQANGAVGDREFAVQAEMDEAGIKHPAILLRATRHPEANTPNDPKRRRMSPEHPRLTIRKKL
jgi:hypothetical protein